MGVQTLKCERGGHTWRRESQRGKPPKNCGDPNCADNIALPKLDSSEVSELTEAFETHGPVISGKDLADRLMLESRGMALHQQNGKSYAGPRY